MADTSGDVDLKIRVARAREAKKEVQGVSHAVRDLGHDVDTTGKKSKDASKGMGLFTGETDNAHAATLGLSGLIGVGGSLLGGLPLLAVGLAGTAAAMAAVAGAAAFGMLVMDRFTASSKTTGTAANALVGAWEGFHKALQTMSAPAADIVLSGLASALKILQPALDSLATPLALFARFLSDAIQQLATGLVPLFPKLAVVITELAPLLAPLPDMVIRLLACFFDLAIVGLTILPAIVTALVWTGNALADVLEWAGQFTTEMQNGTGTGGQFVDILNGIVTATGDVIGVIGSVIGFLKDHKTIVEDLTIVLLTLTAATKAYTIANALAAAKTSIATAATAAWAVVTTAAGDAAAIARAPIIALNIAFATNPVGVVIAALVILVGVFILLYKHAGWFRTAVDAMFGALTAVFNWVKDHWKLILAILTGPMGLFVLFVVSHFDQIVEIFKSLPGRITKFASGMWDGLKTGLVSVLNWVIDKLNWMIKQANKLPFVEIGLLGKIPTGGEKVPGAAQGALVRRGGAVDVGEHGKERVWLPAGAAVQPLPAGGDMPMIIHTHVTLNDTEIALAVHKAAIRKASTR